MNEPSHTENPYESPQSAPSEHPADLQERLKCPACREYEFSYWRVYLWGGVFSLHCPRCSARIRIAKFGFGRSSSVIFGAIGGLLVVASGAAGLAVAESHAMKLLATLGGITVVMTLTLTMDFIIDRRYVYLQCLDRTPGK